MNSAAYWLRETESAPRLVIFSGAGLSKESGMSVFRGSDGLWDNHKVEEVCNGHNWRLFRAQVRDFYERRWQENLDASPHEGHAWCAQQEALGAVLLTQNVDTLLERAGAHHVGHLHGRLDHMQCFSCEFRWERAANQSRDDVEQCPACGQSDTRIDVVFFQERAPAYESARRVLCGLRPHDVLIVIGTAATVVNPVSLLTGHTNVWVVDPDPPDILALYPGAKVWSVPSSEIESTAAKAWELYIENYNRKIP